ncbi:hypothetical protein BDR26DRAFT_949088 [Obelidium mucronatum]|nr:hypothetical protein BDR26DRAFT_949088 [Obelidium mucronatum]
MGTGGSQMKKKKSSSPLPMAQINFINLVTKMNQEKDKDSKFMAHKWYAGFAQRHKNRIKMQTTKAITKARTDPLTLKEIESWVEAFEAWMVKNGYSWLFLTNVDEMRIKLKNSSSNARAIVSTLIARPNKITGTRGQVASFIPFVTANGERILDVIVLPSKF